MLVVEKNSLFLSLHAEEKIKLEKEAEETEKSKKEISIEETVFQK